MAGSSAGPPAYVADAIVLSGIVGSVMKHVRVSLLMDRPRTVRDAEEWPGAQLRELPVTPVVVAFPARRPLGKSDVPVMNPAVTAAEVSPVSVLRQLVSGRSTGDPVTVE